MSTILPNSMIIETSIVRERCPVGYEDFGPDTTAYSHDSEHGKVHEGLCGPCLYAAIKTNEICPICREPIDKASGPPSYRAYADARDQEESSDVDQQEPIYFGYHIESNEDYWRRKIGEFLYINVPQLIFSGLTMYLAPNEIGFKATIVGTAGATIGSVFGYPGKIACGAIGYAMFSGTTIGGLMMGAGIVGATIAHDYINHWCFRG